MALGNIIGGELAEIIARRAEMVVNDVENHAQAMLMRRIDEAAKIVGRAIQPRRREQIDAVVTPAEAALKLGDRHDFEHA